jgi:hypothetical protein
VVRNDVLRLYKRIIVADEPWLCRAFWWGLPALASPCVWSQMLCFMNPIRWSSASHVSLGIVDNNPGVSTWTTLYICRGSYSQFCLRIALWKQSDLPLIGNFSGNDWIIEFQRWSEHCLSFLLVWGRCYLNCWKR